MRLVWTTDPHLDQVSKQAWKGWIDEIASHGADGIVISGDISEGDDVILQLGRIAEQFSVPIYFVLGNHDFYHSAIGPTRQAVIAVSREHESLHYLTDQSAARLAEGVYLVGEDGWGDGIEGDYENSSIRLNDFDLIEDFRGAGADAWKEQIRGLGKECAQRLAEKLIEIPSEAKQVVVVTHVPPYREACWYEGRTTDDNWAPFFVCRQIGDVLTEVAEANPHVSYNVLCGHTHNDGIAKMRDNLIVYTGGAIYGAPDIEGVFEIDSDSCKFKR